ncbi:MAG: hypothetical protein LBG84_05340 [Treponema sp.]|nr:hypothetical protein [Treponema sp.]
MAGRRFTLSALVLWTLLCRAPVFAPPALGAQTPGGAGAFVTITKKDETGATIFIQRLSWGKAEYARAYEVTVERQSDSGWEREVQEKTQEPFIELSLSSGEYRYQIQAYDFLNRPAGNSGWKRFSVLAALKPEIDSFSPAQITRGGVKVPPPLVLRGKDFSPGAKVFLRDRNTGAVVEPMRAQVNETREFIELSLDLKTLRIGEDYDIQVVNPSGLEALAGPLKVRFSLAESVGFTFQGGYTPLLPLPYGTMGDLFFGIDPLGFYLRAGLLPLRAGPLDGGIELSLLWNLLRKDGMGYQARAHFLENRLNLLARGAVIPERLFVNLRLGGGLTYLINLNFTDEDGASRRFSGFYYSAGSDLSLQWFPVRGPSKFASLFVEAGLGYNLIFITGEGARNGMLRFFTGVGAKY